jgi:signal transduction histidine kinase
MARRLLVTYLTITSLVLAIVVIPLGMVFAERERDRLVFDIERDAQAVASLVEDSLEEGSAPTIDSVLADYDRRGGRIVVVDRAGVTVADSDTSAPPPRDFSTRPEIAAALDGRRTSGSRDSDTLGSELMFVAIPVASGGVVHGVVRVTYPTSTLDARVQSTWLRLAGLAAVVLVVVAVVGIVLARQVSRPVRRLQVASAQLATGDLTTRVPTDEGPRELRDLASTFNTTTQRLATLIESQQRFVADASHQLRSPLTALRLRLETLAPWVPDEAAPKLDAAIAETHRLGRLVQSLLVLARNDVAAPPRVRIALTSLVTERVHAWAPVALEQGVDLRAELPGVVEVDAVEGAIEQILDNLLSNALEVAPVGSAITVRAAVVQPWIELHVIDEGPGLSLDDRRRAFERFWRPRGAGPEGFGLGLAIVDQLARASGGEARLDAGPGEVGVDAVVRLVPSAASSSPDTADAYLPLTSG